MRIALVLLLATFGTLESGCCPKCKQQVCPEVKPGACHVCLESEQVARTAACLQGCKTPECRSGCCHRLSLVAGTDEERAALRSCIRECAP